MSEEVGAAGGAQGLHDGLHVLGVGARRDEHGVGGVDDDDVVETEHREQPPVTGTATPEDSRLSTCAPSPSTRTSASAGSSVASAAKSPTSSQPKDAGTTATRPAAAAGSATA